MSNASIFVQGNNLCYWAANKEGIDPEYISTDGYSRIERFKGTVTVGLNLKF